jgi:hypothetical protein
MALIICRAEEDDDALGEKKPNEQTVIHIYEPYIRYVEM